MRKNAYAYQSSCLLDFIVSCLQMCMKEFLLCFIFYSKMKQTQNEIHNTNKKFLTSGERSDWTFAVVQP